MISKILHSRNQRTRILCNNILVSGVFKIIGLLTSLLIVPITINYLNNEGYGVWITINSMLFWVSVFDIGLGNGMRNYLAAAIARNDYKEGQKQISTTFFFLGIIAMTLLAIIIVPICLFDTNKLFNTESLAVSDLRLSLLVAIIFTLMNFVCRNIGMIFIALQKYAINDLLNVSGNIISLIIIIVLTRTTQGNLIYVVAAYTITPVVVYLLASIPLFRTHPDLRPRKEAIDLRIGQTVIRKSMGFFVIQVTSCLVIFGAANFFITQFYGPTQVTVYNIAYKYFNLLVIAYTIVLSPMWNAYTDAYVKGDWIWIRKTFKRAINIWLFSLVIGCLMLGASSLFYQLWVGNKVTIPFSVSLSTLIYVCFFNLNNCTTYLINGINKIKIQIITSVYLTILYIGVTYFVTGKYHIEGIILSMAASYAVMSCIHYYQCWLIINQKAKGIWYQ